MNLEMQQDTKLIFRNRLNFYIPVMNYQKENFFENSIYNWSRKNTAKKSRLQLIKKKNPRNKFN